MASILNYALSAQDAFSVRPLCRVDSLCLSWFAYLHLRELPETSQTDGLTLTALGSRPETARLAAALHDPESTALLVQALALSARFGKVLVCRHVDDADATAGRQFSATTFVLPDGCGAYVAFRGTDNTILGWQENLRLAGSAPVPAQEAALQYLESVAAQVEGPLWVGGHSKGATLAAYACGKASDAVRARIACCFSHDGPGVNACVRADGAWHDDVVVDKTVPRESLVGMLFERSQTGIVAVRSSGTGLRQHGPFTWEVAGNDFVVERGLSFEVWRLSQRLSDWLEELGESQREEFIELACWLMETTGESTFSGLLARWQTNAQAMRAALEAAPVGDRTLFAQAMDELVADLLLGSAAEHGIGMAETPQATAGAAARKVEDATAHTNDLLARLDRLAGL